MKGPSSAAPIALLALAACAGGEEVAVPGFAAGLPGHTVAVAWSEAPEALAALPPDLPLPELGVVPAASAPAGVRAWLGDAGEIGWESLAGNAHFRAAMRELAPARVHAFVDLQQAIDLLRAAAAPGAGDGGPFARLRTLVERRAAQALRLDALQWLLVGSADSGLRAWEGVLATAEPHAGLTAFLAERSLPPPAALPSSATAGLAATLVPEAAARVVREVLGDAEGPLAALQQILGGAAGVQAGLAALAALDGALVAAMGQGWAFAACGVRDAAAVEAALDTFASVRGGHWLVAGTVRVELGDKVVTLASGDVPAGRALPGPQDGALRLWTEGIELRAARAGGRVRLRLTLP